MKRIHILTEEHYTSDGKLRIGGLHNYVHSLAAVLGLNGYEVYIHETSIDGIPFSFFHDFVSIKGYHIVGGFRHRCLKLQRILVSSDDYQKGDLVIWATDYMAYYNKLPNAIALQHGIAWDVPRDMKACEKWLRLFFMMRQKMSILKKVSGLVSVDYNYWNWLRANYPAENLYKKIRVIPNFVTLSNEEKPWEKNVSSIKICFARRFEDYRGVNVMIEAIRLLSSEVFFPSVSFVFAGDGPLKETILKKLSYSNVLVTSYDADQAVNFHRQMSIAVVPTVGSEGTSLSALEAMAAGCAIISTPVGGLSNIVIDGFTGLIVKPDPKELASAIKKLCLDPSMRAKLAKNAFEEAKEAFSKHKWSDAWLDFIHKSMGY